MYKRNLLYAMMSGRELDRTIVRLSLLARDVYVKWLETDDPADYDMFCSLVADSQMAADELDYRAFLYEGRNTPRS